MSILGYTPDLTVCAVCGRKQPVRPLLGIQTGHVVCSSCRSADIGTAVPLCEDSLRAMQYIVSAPAKQLFSFHVANDALNRLSECCERYLTEQSGRHFATLDYWKRLRNQW